MKNLSNNKAYFSNRQILLLIIPLVIEQLLTITVGLADSIMVAQVGESAVSAVSLVDNINILLINCFAALATGGGIVVGQYIGSGDLKKANHCAKQMAVLMIAISLVVTLFLYVFRTFILTHLFGNISNDVMDYCNTYYIILEASIPFIAIYNIGAIIFRIIGNSTIPMIVSLIMNIINIAGNAILIFGFNMEIEGVAIPSLVSRIVAAVLIFIMIFNKKNLVHFSIPFKYKYDAKSVKTILSLAIPSGLESSLFQLGKILLLSVVSAFGTNAITANAVGNTICSFQILAAQSIAIGMVTIVSRCVGANDFKSARYYTRLLMKYAYIFMIISCVLIYLVLPFILDIYNLSEETSRMVMEIMNLHTILGSIFWPLSFTLPQTLKSAGDTKFVMIVATLSMWIFRIFFGILFARYFGFGMIGIWYAMFIDWIVRIICFVIRYKGNKWEKIVVKNTL